MPIFRNILLDAIPAFIILIILEIIYAIQTQRKLYEVKDAAYEYLVKENSTKKNTKDIKFSALIFSPGSCSRYPNI
mgnify:CR=1 FL=1